LSTIPITLRNLLRWARKVGVELEDHFRGLSTRAKGFDDFVATLLTHADLVIETHKYEVPAKQVYRGQSKNSVYQVDLITGLFHVNGNPVGKLHHSITVHKDFQRVFSSTIFEVREETRANSISGSFSTALKFNNCKYNFYMNVKELIITEIHEDGNEYQLISHSHFNGDVPYLLVNEFSHWRHLKTNVIHFRPINFLSPKFAQPPEYTLDLSNKELTQTSTNRNLVDINSTAFQRIVRIMQRLEHINQILVFSNTEQLIVELPRMALHFNVDRSGVIHSKEYSGMSIANTQQMETLIGLQNGILLKSPDFDEYTTAPVLLVPNGPVSGHRNFEEKIHHTVHISTQKLEMPQYFAFEVDIRLKRLRAGQSRIGWLYLAYLHAVTASPMLDPFTQMTGTEVALQLLQSPLCWSCEPLDKAAKKILAKVGLDRDAIYLAYN